MTINCKIFFCLNVGIGILLALSSCTLSNKIPTPSNTPVAFPTSTLTITPIISPTDTPTITLTPTTSSTHGLTPNPTLAVGSTWTRPADGMVMVSVPAGSFNMGSNGGDLDKTPVHKVNLDAFWIDKTEVTNRMYADCVTAGACQAPSSSQSFTHNNYYDNPQYADYPVVYVGWNSAQSYCKWAGARLPSEAEWEKAARGTDGRIFPWGNDGPDNSLLNYNQNIGDTTAVGSYPSGASPYGALDMAGNVWEWVSDWYDKTYYDQSARSNPEGPSDGTYRVMRGGAWNSDDYYVLASSRGGSNPANAYYEFGIRCSRSSP